jgi:CheY-like chemotaxis protein
LSIQSPEYLKIPKIYLIRISIISGVFMDLQMLVMGGIEATKIIRDENSDVLDHKLPIITMTANAMKGDREMCMKTRINDYISKPIP